MTAAQQVGASSRGRSLHIAVGPRETAETVIGCPERRKADTANVVGMGRLDNHIDNLECMILPSMLPPCLFVMVMVKEL